MRREVFILFLSFGIHVECKPKDYYKVLNIEPNSDLPTIKRAFREQAKIYHPDKNDSPDAEQKFKDIQEAYDVLKSDKSRRLYDESRAGGYDFNPGSTHEHQGFRPAFFRAKPFKFNFESMFEDLMGGGGPSQGGFGFGSFGFEDLFKDFAPMPGMHNRKGRKSGGGGMKCKTTVKQVGGITTTIMQCE